MIAQILAIEYSPGPEPATEQDPLAEDSPTLRDIVRGALARGGGGRNPRVDDPSLRPVVRPGHLVFQDRSFCRRGAAGERPAGNGVSSFVHVEDAARAAMLAIDWPTGVVNIVDDEPAAGTEWLPHFAAAIGAPAPPMAEHGGGERGASNWKARQELGWKPLHPTWRSGFRTALESGAENWKDHGLYQRSIMDLLG